MKPSVIITLLFCLSSSAFAQTKGYNRINFGFVQQYYFNKSYVDNDSKADSHPLHAHNTLGHNYVLEFERVTRYGLILNAGFQYGVQHHDVDIIRDLSNFDPEAINSLHGSVYRENISATAHYIAPRLMLGYRKTLNNVWSVTAKAGISRKMFLDGKIGGSPSSVTVNYVLDDNTSYRSAGFLARQWILGDPKYHNGRYFSTSINTYELYGGIERTLPYRYLKNISLGIEATLSTGFNKLSGQFIQAISRDKWQQTDQTQMNVDWYNNKSCSIGLRIGVGLWK
jgi:hypothetical protein